MSGRMPRYLTKRVLLLLPVAATPGPMPALPAAFEAESKRDFPADFTHDGAQRSGHLWSRLDDPVFAPSPSAIALPRSTAEVSRLLRLATEHRVPVVPSGGRTGLAARRRRGARRASSCRSSACGAWTRSTHAPRRDRTRPGGRGHRRPCTSTPRSTGSRGPSTSRPRIEPGGGGNISTNAGGVKVIRYGLTRQWVLGLEVVLASGDVLELGGALEKNNTGIDLRHVFIGSEGTLGIITEATLKLNRPPEKVDVFLFAVPDLASVLVLFREARSGPFGIMAYEFFTEKCLARVRRRRSVGTPLQTPTSDYYVLLEGGARGTVRPRGRGPPRSSSASWSSTARSRSATRQAADLWALREGASARACPPLACPTRTTSRSPSEGSRVLR